MNNRYKTAKIKRVIRGRLLYVDSLCCFTPETESKPVHKLPYKEPTLNFNTEDNTKLLILHLYATRRYGQFLKYCYKALRKLNYV